MTSNENMMLGLKIKLTDGVDDESGHLQELEGKPQVVPREAGESVLEVGSNNSRDWGS